MKLIDDIGRFFGLRQLKAELQAARSTRVSNFGSAKSVALVYEEKGESFFILVKQYVDYLKSEHGIREVMAFAYIPDKKAIPHWQVHKLKYDYFSKGETTWKQEPAGDAFNLFVNKPYDILIDLERHPVLPLQFCIARSKATFKVGHYHEDREALYDLMFKTDERGAFDAYISQLNHYLKRINTHDQRA